MTEITHYGWDGDTLAYESTEQSTKHYIYEKDSFIPLLQASYVGSISLHQTPDWTSHKYNFYGDPLWKVTKKSKGFDNVCFYHCDHLGTPQEMSDETGAIVWTAEYKAWVSEDKKNNIFPERKDEEIGLHQGKI